MSHIAIISGTNRPGSNTAIVAAHLEAMYRDIGHPTVMIDLAKLPPEIFSPTSYAEKPAAFAHFSETVLASGGLHVVTPEYNGSFPGVLKYFIDMLKFPESFEGRPVCFTGLSAGIWGALRSTEQLSAIFAYRNAYIYPERVFMPQINRHVDAGGKLTNDDWLARLRSQAQGFVKFTSAFAKV